MAWLSDLAAPLKSPSAYSALPSSLCARKCEGTRLVTCLHARSHSRRSRAFSRTAGAAGHQQGSRAPAGQPFGWHPSSTDRSTNQGEGSGGQQLASCSLQLRTTRQTVAGEAYAALMYAATIFPPPLCHSPTPSLCSPPPLPVVVAGGHEQPLRLLSDAQVDVDLGHQLVIAPGLAELDSHNERLQGWAGGGGWGGILEGRGK